MDGYELASLLRGDPRTRSLPIIFVTAASGEESQVFKGYESGAVDYIVKPYDPRVLLSKARVFLELHRVSAALAEKLEALAASEERFRSLVMTIPDIVYRIDPQGRFTFLNDAVQALGYEPGELIGRHFSDILLPADLKAVSREFALPRWAGRRCAGLLDRLRLFDERRTGPRKTVGLELRLRPHAKAAASPLRGRFVTVEVSSSGLFSAPLGSGRPVFLGTVGVIRDISGRKQAEAELARYREHLEYLVQERTAALERRDLELERAAQQWQATFDAMRDGVALLDAELRMVRCNRALAELLGRPAAELAGQPYWSISLGEALRPEDCPCLRVRQSLSRETAQVQAVGRWFDLVADPILDEAGRLDGIVYTVSDRTEDRRAQEVLMRYATIVGSSDDAIIAEDLDGVVTSWNQGAEMAFGYSEREAVGRPLADLTLPDDRRDEESVILGQVRQGRPMRHYETLRHRKDGRLLAMSITVSPLRDEQGQVVGASKIARDITARKQTERVLWETKERLEAAASAGIVGIWDWDVPNNRLVWDSVMYRLYGLQPADFGGAYEAWLNALHPEDKACVQEDAQAALRGEREYAPEFRVVWPDGSVRHLKAAARTTFDEQGKPLRMIGVNYDLTSQKTIEKTLELRVAERTAELVKTNQHLAQTQFAMDRVGMGIEWVEAATGRIRYVNQAAADMLGYTVEEMLGMSLMDLDPRLTPALFRQEALDIRERAGYARFETTNRTKSGECVPIEATVRYLPSLEDAAGRFVLFVTDITQRKEMERTLPCRVMPKCRSWP